MDDDFLYQIRPPVRKQFAAGLQRRLSNRYALDAAVESGKSSRETSRPRPASAWGARLGSWGSALAAAALILLVVFAALKALPPRSPQPARAPMAALTGAAGTPAPTPSTETPGRPTPRARPATGLMPVVDVGAGDPSGFQQVRAAGLGRTIHSVLDTSPDGNRLLVAAYNLKAEGVGATVVSSYSDLLYVTDLQGSYLVKLSTRFKNRRAAPYTLAAWLPGGERIAMIDSDADGPGVFVVNADGSGRTRLTPAGVTPLWLIPSPEEEVVFWQEGEWQIDPARLLAGERVARWGTYFWTTLDGRQTEPAWPGLERFELVVSPSGDRLAALDREHCPAPAQTCPALKILGLDGSQLWQVDLGGQLLSFDWLPDGERLLLDVIESREGSYRHDVSVWNAGDQSLRTLTPLQVTETHEMNTVEAWIPQGANQALLYHPAWPAPRLLDLETLQVSEAGGLALPGECRTAGRCPELTFVYRQ